ncbi:MAG TPA: alanine racemase [Dermatophilaceae bacterium]|nr:alanine racemase [Dermatophilaceae bacterium]
MEASSGAGEQLPRLSRAAADLDGPLAVVDLDALEDNARLLERNAGGVPIRVVSKSLRVRALVEQVRARPGWRGVLTYAAAEAVWLARSGHRDLVVAYPSADRESIREIAGDPGLAEVIVLTVDSVEHLDRLRRVVPGARLRLSVDVDAALAIGGRRLGVLRSPLRTVADVLAVVRAAQADGHAVVGLMVYDAQIAGLPDTSPLVRQVKARSDEQLRGRRTALVEAVRAVADLELVNGGGSGSLHVTGRDPALTELAAGSGLLAPAVFDGYDALAGLRPALLLGVPVSRRPGPGVVTLSSGGYAASGPPGWSRLPRPHAAYRLRLRRSEGGGEVQTPLQGAAADGLRVGDLVWLRPAKSGEVLERFDRVHLVRGERVVDTVPTYRGEGQCFG